MFDAPVPGELVCTEARLINLCGVIEELLVQRVVRGLYQLACTGPEPITLLISSEGGSVYDANAIVDAIVDVRKRGVEVTARVHGYAMSAAVFPLLVATHRIATPSSIIMVHGMTSGNVGDLRSLKVEQGHNDWLMEQQAAVLGKYSHRDAEFWRGLLVECIPNYYDAAQALEMGLIDGVDDGNIG